MPLCTVWNLTTDIQLQSKTKNKKSDTFLKNKCGLYTHNKKIKWTFLPEEQLYNFLMYTNFDSRFQHLRRENPKNVHVGEQNTSKIRNERLHIMIRNIKQQKKAFVIKEFSYTISLLTYGLLWHNEENRMIVRPIFL